MKGRRVDSFCSICHAPAFRPPQTLFILCTVTGAHLKSGGAPTYTRASHITQRVREGSVREGRGSIVRLVRAERGACLAHPEQHAQHAPHPQLSLVLLLFCLPAICVGCLRL